MWNQKLKNNRGWYGAAILVLMLGCLAAGILTIPTLSTYPALIAEVYKDPLQKIEIPGEADLELSRKGAYAVYYERRKDTYILEEMPPTLDCSLTSKTTDKDVPLVPDYVPSNQYSTKNGNKVGVLIYSTTVQHPGLHTLSCGYPDRRESPKLALAIGPNYVFEFLRVAWNLGGSVLGGAGILCASSTLAFVVVFVVFLRRSTTRANGEVQE